MARYLYYYTHIPEPFAAAAALLSADPSRWLPAPAAAHSNGWHVNLVAEDALPDPLAHRSALVTVGPAALTGPAHLVRPLTWRATSTGRWFPVLNGDLELAGLDGSGCQLSLMGTYRPPLGVTGEIGDRLAGHRIAEACARRFILDLSDRLANATAPSLRSTRHHGSHCA